MRGACKFDQLDRGYGSRDATLPICWAGGVHGQSRWAAREPSRSWSLQLLLSFRLLGELTTTAPARRWQFFEPSWRSCLNPTMRQQEVKWM